MFSSVFFLTDDKLLPKSFYARICYGAAAGLMCMIMRSVGKFEDSTVFAVLLANGLATAFDKLLTKRERHLVAAENAKVRAALADKLEEKALENGKGGAENA